MFVNVLKSSLTCPLLASVFKDSTSINIDRGRVHSLHANDSSVQSLHPDHTLFCLFVCFVYEHLLCVVNA